MTPCPRCKRVWVPIPQSGATTYHYICEACWDLLVKARARELEKADAKKREAPNA